MSKKTSLLAIILATTLLTGCTSPVGPQASGVELPSLWSRLTGSTADLQVPLASNAEAKIDQQWWTHFADPTLDSLLTQALANNKTLQIAKVRVEEARAARGTARAALFPQINGTASAQRGNQGYSTFDKPVGIAGADVEASWELDLFGRNQARTAQATALLQSADASQRAVRVGLLAEVARNYFAMRNDERQINLTRQNLETQRRTLQLIQAQLQGAMASDFDVQRAAAQVSTTEALIPSLQRAYETARNHLNVLLGAPPGSKDALLQTPQELNPLDPQIVVAAPAQIVENRPDIRVAERQFAASLSAKDAARAELFPDISLSALFGVQSSTPFSAVQPWNVGANLVQPILNFGRIEAQIDIADAQQREAFLHYQETVLEGLEDMENALSSYLHETTRNAALTASVAQNRKAADLAQQQYNNGYTGLLDVLVAQRNLLDAEASKAASDADLRVDLVNIYTEAGGGWKD